MRVLSLAKKPGTVCGGRVCGPMARGGDLSEDHPAREAGITHDLISMIPIEELEDDDVTMDPAGKNLFRKEDIHRWLNEQHDWGFRVGHVDREKRPTWPTKVEMTLDDYRRFNGPEPAEYVENDDSVDEDEYIGGDTPLLPGMEDDYGDDDREDEVHDMLEYYTNRMDNAATTGDRYNLDFAYGQAVALLEEDLAHVAEDHHREYLERYYEDALSRLPRRSGRVRRRQEDEEFDPNRTRRRF